MTSNTGSELLAADRADPGVIPEKTRRAVMDELRRTFRPEFLNRLDEVVLFHPLGRVQIEAIVRIQLAELARRLAEQDLKLELTEKAIAWVARVGFDPVYGARPLKRTIQREIETPLARQIVGGKVAPGSVVTVDVAGEGLEIKGIAV